MTFQEQEKDLLTYYLQANLFNKDNTAEVLNSKTNVLDIQEIYTTCTSRPAPNYINIELIVRPECNQNCSYCYIAQHGKELYPIDERADKETLLNHLRSLLDYIYVRYRLFIGDYELFAGDMFYDGLYFDMLDIFYEYLSKEHELYPNLYNANSPYKMKIAAPVNMSFTLIPGCIDKFERYYNKFQAIGVELWLSASIDGAYAVDTREKRVLPDSYFDTIFEFCKKFGYFFHPMISSWNIHNWIKNYDWWKEMIEKHNFLENRTQKDFLPMMLEVRNDDWTDETINELIKFYDYIYNDRLSMNDNDIHKMARHIFIGDGEENSLTGLNHYDPLRPVADPDTEGILCTVQTTLHIQLNNLSIIPSHRTAYKQFVAGKFILSKDQKKIIDIEPGNVNAFMTILDIRRASMPKCVHCIVQPICVGGCMGAQYESSGEILQPNPSCCKMFKKKFAFLLYKMEETGVWEEGIDCGFIHPGLIHAMDRVRDLDDYKEFKENGIK